MKNELKYLFTLIGLLLFDIESWACEACAKQQPAITKGLTHGVGPQSNWDWVIIAIIALITVLTLFFSVKYLIRPGEKNTNHIKQSILNN